MIYKLINICNIIYSFCHINMRHEYKNMYRCCMIVCEMTILHISTWRNMFSNKTLSNRQIMQLVPIFLYIYIFVFLSIIFIVSLEHLKVDNCIPSILFFHVKFVKIYFQNLTEWIFCILSWDNSILTRPRYWFHI